MLETDGMQRPLRLVATVLAWIVAGTYLAIALGLVADDFKSPPIPVMFIAAAAYLVGGYLILRADRRLLLIGAVINFLVLAAFAVSALTDRATVDAVTVVGKVAQVGVGLILLWLVFGRRESEQPVGRVRM